MRPTRILATGAALMLLTAGCGTASEPTVPVPPAGGAEPAPSGGTASPSESAEAGQGAGLDAIKAGDRKILIHLAEADRDLSATYEGPVTTGDGTDDGALFRLLPVVDGQYMIEALRPREEGGRWCVVVDDRANPRTLATAECAEEQRSRFALTETGGSDDKGRPTHHLTNDAYGAVQYSGERQALYVEEVGDAPIAGTFSLVDRGRA
ncbi:hypothetical protein J2S43_002297 [Catenuloplanes nepalensis]|uniref:Secreted protein n=1 Tax=Catenuloplanes nepalensis TaxID=587533 RepID=A0ABT9MQU5_9ACTN|nr:hypothetical protein [Catenuloplanes nepalensis]MDP9793785.1 hypothetical protein [Catenuloplanes nepalensis]